MLIEFLVIGLAAMAGGGFVAYRVGRARGAARALAPRAGSKGGAPALDRTLKDVRVDDVVQLDGRDWLVEGVVQYDEDGHTWRAARTLDTPDERWFVVGMERQSEMTIRFLAVLKDLEITGYPPEALDYGGVSYKLAQRGTATTTVTGALGDIPIAKVAGTGKVARCRWWRYAAAGDKTLLVEQWGDTYRALSGTLTAPDAIDLLAGS